MLPVIYLYCLFSSVTPSINADLFKSITVDDVQITERGTYITDHADRISCGVACVLSGDECVGFHVTNGAVCFVLMNRDLNWSEKASGSVVLWLRLGADSGLCNGFPLIRGRSRYKLVKEKEEWSMAAKNCEKFNSKLVQLTTNSEKNFLSEKVPQMDDIWNGLHEDEKEVARWHRSGDLMNVTSCSACDGIDWGYLKSYLDKFIKFIKPIIGLLGGKKKHYLCECLIV